MSDRLDIVRLIDSKVSATRRTVARSKQLAEAAKDDLTTHEEWLEHHRQHARQDLEQHQRRLSRRRRVEACKHFALWLLLLVPSACVAVFRAAGAGLAALGEAFYFGWYWIGTTAYALGRWLIRLVAGSITWAATTLFTLALWVAAGFWLILSWLGAGTGQIAVSAFGAGSRGLHLARPKVAQPRPLARSGFVVWLLPARRPDREPRRPAHWRNRRADRGPRHTMAPRRHASRGEARADPRPAPLASGSLRPPARRA